MLGYVMVGTNDIENSANISTEEKQQITQLYNAAKAKLVEGRESSKPHDGNPATVGNGTMMALFAPSHEMVDKIHTLALELGATCEGPVGPRPEYDEKFYAGYFRDPEGNKLNVFHFPPS